MTPKSDRGLPAFLYGTAWKEDETARLTRMAIESGFRGIDTANQRRHYHEVAVGTAVAQAIAEGIVTREDLFLQTKFTSRDGQDHRLPYDPHAPAAEQVRQSFRSSLEHLQVDTIDSYVLHGPSRRHGLTAFDLEVWNAMEALSASGAVRHLGVSNVALDQIEELCERATIRPLFVQNRCFAATGWDRDVRQFCRAHGLVYQGFSLLTANLRELQNPAFLEIVQRRKATAAQIVFRFALGVGMLPLTGTTSRRHMEQDLAAAAIELTAEELAIIERIAG